MLDGDHFRGSLVSIDCGKQGYFQGRIVDIDNLSKTITIEKPFKDGIPMNERTLKLYGEHIIDLKVLQMSEQEPIKIPASADEHLHSTDLQHSKNIRTSLRNAVKDDQEEPSSYSFKRQISELRRDRVPHIPLHSIPVSVLHDQHMVERLRKSEKSAPLAQTMPQGVRISVNDLLARPSSSGNSMEGSGQTSPIDSSKKYKEYGQFKLFEEQQVPEPCRLRVNKNKRAQGPCGIPEIDCTNGYDFTNKHPALSQPLDYKLMNTDFDFDANLALFNKESLSDNEKELSSPELRDAPSSTSRNYRHDENILDDPSRVISWLTNSQQQASTMFKPIRLEQTSEGFFIPILTAEDKEAEKFLGTDVLFSILADRLLLYILNVMDRFELLVKTVVVIGSENTSDKLIMRLLQHLSNRSCSTVCYGIDYNTRHNLPYINFVDHVSKIPIDVQLVIILDSSSLPKALQMWIKRVGNGPKASHIISIEEKIQEVVYSHTLYMGTLVENPLTNNKQLFKESAVTEIGCPFDWFEEDSYQALIEAFGSQVFVNY